MIGQALISAALDGRIDEIDASKRTHINLRPKAMNPRGMVLDSVRFPVKHRGKRGLHSLDQAIWEENLMALQNENVQQKRERGLGSGKKNTGPEGIELS